MKARALAWTFLFLSVAMIAPWSLAQSDPLSGTWSGDWGPTATHRNPVTVQLLWDGATLTGVVNPGPMAIELAKASYNPGTNVVMMEADAENHGRMVHYMIEGKLEGTTMTGTWNHDNRRGDFRIMKN